MFEEKMLRIMTALGVKTDSDLARALDITPPSVASARAKKLIPIGWIEKISTTSNISMDWLYYGRGPMRPGEAHSAPEMPPAAPTPPAPQEELTTCERCKRLEKRLEAFEEERREITAENRQLSAENRQLWKENRDFAIEIGQLKEKCARLEARERHGSNGGCVANAG